MGTRLICFRRPACRCISSFPIMATADIYEAPADIDVHIAYTLFNDTPSVLKKKRNRTLRPSHHDRLVKLVEPFFAAVATVGSESPSNSPKPRFPSALCLEAIYTILSVLFESQGMVVEPEYAARLAIRHPDFVNVPNPPDLLFLLSEQLFQFLIQLTSSMTNTNFNRIRSSTNSKPLATKDKGYQALAHTLANQANLTFLSPLRWLEDALSTTVFSFFCALANSHPATFRTQFQQVPFMVSIGPAVLVSIANAAKLRHFLPWTAASAICAISSFLDTVLCPQFRAGASAGKLQTYVMS